MRNPYALLQTLGIPVAYFKFDREVDFPYIVYMGAGSNNLEADNKVYHKENTYKVEFYYQKKNEEVENTIEELFNDNKIIWSKSEDVYIDDEKMFVIFYYIK